MMHQMFDMLDQQKMAQTVFNLAKDYTASTTQMMKTATEQYEKALDTMLKQGLVAQEQGQKLLSDWMTRAKQGQEQYYKMMDENIRKMESMFSPDGQKRTMK